MTSFFCASLLTLSLSTASEPAKAAAVAEPAKVEPAKAVAPPIDVTKLTDLSIDPPKISLDDPRSRQRLLATAKLGDMLVDVTDLAAFTTSNPKIAQVNDRREASPLGDGSCQVTAAVGKLSAVVPVEVKNYQKGRPINFPNEIIPVFSKLTCNSGGCHGKSGGQNGFSLSLLGYQPIDDYDFLVKEGRGRRIFPAAPEQSLLIRKATGSLPHGGGKLLKADDDMHQLLVDWVKQGMPYGGEKDPTVERIDVHPPQRVMERNRSQRLRVSATFSDGRTEDVTRFVQFQSNDDAVASVDNIGRVSTHDLAGEAAVMARYQGRVAVFRAAVPVGLSLEKAPAFVERGFLDTLSAKKWKDLGIVPSEKSTDYQFVRRIHLDLTGRLPSPTVVAAFVTDSDPSKRDKLIDRLLAGPEYASYMALKWGAILQNKRSGKEEYTAGTHAMSLWLKNAFQKDMPYDKFVRAIVTASGTPEVNPPVMWYRVVRTNEDNVDSISQLFLGTRIQCAHCHHHPFEKWSQDDYYGMASFFARTGRKRYGTHVNGQEDEAVFVARAGSAKHPRTNQEVKPKGLDGPALDVPPGVDPRSKLAEWMTDPKNPFLAKALVNRIWGHFFSRGIVEPVDDMRVTNPPVNPELLDALADDFVKNGFSIKRLVRTICQSSTYQLSSEPNKYNVGDKQHFARYYPKRLQAEVLLDALDTATGVPTSFGFPADMNAVDLPDEQIGSYFLDIFGRPARASSCECERGNDANLSQALHLLNSAEVQGKLTSDAGRAAKLAADKRPDAEKVAELFLSFFTRPPRAEELKAALEHISSKPDKKTAYQNLIWALLNAKEFQFNT